MQKSHYIYVTLAFLVGLSWWLIRLSEPELPVHAVVSAHSADYFSTGYTKIEMNSSGLPKNKVIADKVVHFSDDDTTELQNPLMTIFKQDGPNWVIRSETGIIPAGGRDMFLNGKVFIHRETAPGIKPMKINTSNLRIKPKQDYAETDEWAELIMPPNRTTGIGMQANFGEPLIIKLLSNVRGKYE
jgi:lipopolysaccharide export system protein LptC